jgi:hypothetical protein
MTEKKFQWEYYGIDDFKKDIVSETIKGMDPEEDEEDIKELERTQTIHATPMGYFLKDDSMNPLRVLEHYICHVNFDISMKIVAVLSNVPGVETLTIVSRYQFIVGIGKMFDSKTVRKAIENELIDINQILPSKLNRMIDKLRRETFLGQL